MNFSPWRVHKGNHIVAAESAWQRIARVKAGRVEVPVDVFEDSIFTVRNSAGLPLQKSILPGQHWFGCAALYGPPDGSRVTVRDIRRRLFDLIDSHPGVTWILRTERPENVTDILEPRRDGSLDRHGRFTTEKLKPSERYAAFDRPNLWLAVPIRTRKQANERIPHLLRIDCARRVLDVTPEEGIDLTAALPHYECDAGQWRRLYGPPNPMDGIDCGWRGLEIPKRFGGEDRNFRDCLCPGCWVQNVDRVFGGIDWLRVIGDTGRDAKPMHPDWVRSLRDQAVAAGVPFWLQWGTWIPWDIASTYERGAKRVHNFVGGERVVNVGASKSGAMLDGREWRQEPEVSK